MDYHFALHVFHVLFVGGLFVYVGTKGGSLSPTWFNFLLVLGVFILFYHLYRASLVLKAKGMPWVNLFHVLIVAPLLILIGWRKSASPRYYFEFLLMLGFAAIGYHGYYLIKQ